METNQSKADAWESYMETLIKCYPTQEDQLRYQLERDRAHPLLRIPSRTKTKARVAMVLP